MLGAFGCDDAMAPPAPPPAAPSATASAETVGDDRMKGEILRNVMQLLGTAATRPGGANIGIATENLNQYFGGRPAADFRLGGDQRAFLTEQLADFPFKVDDFDSPRFEVKDARHIEDCLMYHSIAPRAAGEGTTLERVRNLFNWTIQQVGLVPPGAMIPAELEQQGIQHVPARPYDVLTRGLATEQTGTSWAERSWTFMSLCRQIGVDVALLAFDVEGKPLEPRIWCCAALVDGKPYLFDAGAGIEIRASDDRHVATIDDVVADPDLLARLDLPGITDYPTHAKDLGPGKLRVLIDSSRQYFAPRMNLLQRDLAAGNRMIVYRDPIEQRDAFAAALGDRSAGVSLWALPLNVEFRLFNDPKFVAATQYINAMFTPELPLLGARLLQLKGDHEKAKEGLVGFRFRQAIKMGKDYVRLPDEAHQSLDLHATYFLAMSQLEEGNTDEGTFLLEQWLKLAPSPQRGFVASLYGWAANSNLGRLYDAKGQDARAITHYCRGNPTPEALGNLVRARTLVWKDPFGPAPDFSAPDPSADAEKPASD